MQMVGRLSRKLLLLLCNIALLLSLNSCRHHRTDDGGRSRSKLRREARSSGTTAIPLERESGVYYIKVKVNDVPMRFILDTGASAVSISLTEAMFLYKQGTLTEEDFGGRMMMQDANGDNSETQVVNLRKLAIGNFELHNVKAIVVQNQKAPLLLGQSALQSFRRFYVDNSSNELILED